MEGMKYTVKCPFVDDMGSISDFHVEETLSETKEEAALWWINTMRDHDGLDRWEVLPYDFEFLPII